MSEHEPIAEAATLKDQVQQSRRDAAGPVVELYRSQISRSAEIDWREDDDHQERLYLRVLAALGESLSADEEPLKLFAGAFDLLLVTSDRILWVEAKPRLGRAHAPKSVIAIDRFACQSKVKRGMVTSTLTLSAPGPAKVTCLLYTSPSPRDGLLSRMPSSA